LESALGLIELFSMSVYCAGEMEVPRLCSLRSLRSGQGMSSSTRALPTAVIATPTVAIHPSVSVRSAGLNRSSHAMYGLSMSNLPPASSTRRCLPSPLPIGSTYSLARSTAASRSLDLKLTLHLPLEGLDYWAARVRGQQRNGGSLRKGYFAGRELSDAWPLLSLVAPALRTHPATDTLLAMSRPKSSGRWFRWRNAGVAVSER